MDMEKLHEEEMRWVYAETLIELVEEGVDIVLVEADLARTNGTDRFGKKFPERFIDVGVAETNMISLAAGIASMGRIPFASSFGSFGGRRVIDQLFMAVSYSNLNIKFIGSDPGVTGEINGASHQAFEDIALMRALPRMSILEPCDAYELRQVVREAAFYQGAVYIRMMRKIYSPVFDANYRFTIGRGCVIRPGIDVAIIAVGYMVKIALEAAKILERKKIAARIINMPCIKPLDKELVLISARETGAIVTAENHNIIGGLGSAVCELVSEESLTPVRRIGMPDHIGEVGTADYLCKKFGMTAQDIVEQTMKVIEIKKRRCE